MDRSEGHLVEGSGPGALFPPWRSPGSRVQHDRRSRKLHIGARGEPLDGCLQIRQKEDFEIVVADVAGRHQEQLPGSPPKKQRVREVRVLCYDDQRLAKRKLADLMVGRLVGPRKVERVNRAVPQFTKSNRKPAGKLRVEEEVHAARGSILLTRVSRAAYASAARMSSCSRSS